MRPIFLGGLNDPGAFFLKKSRSGVSGLTMDENCFYTCWYNIIRLYGIKNPHTGRGAILGLLPHGPNSVRDVLATHVLKKTGSYEQAGFAIQDSARTIERHYGHFHPRHKAEAARALLDSLWI